MNTARKWFAPGILTTLLGAFALPPSETSAAAIRYETTGSVATLSQDGSNGGGDPNVRFEGVSDGALDLIPTTGGEGSTGSDHFKLGSLVIQPLPSGAIRTYDASPFEIIARFSSEIGSQNDDVAIITGHLDGILKGGIPSLLRATIDQVQFQPHTTAVIGQTALETYSVRFDSLISRDSFALATDSNGQGQAEITGVFQAVPEPSVTALLFVAVGGGALLRMRKVSVERRQRLG